MKLRIRFRRVRKQWRWHMTLLNGTIVGASTEGYTHRSGCLKNFKLVTGFTMGPFKGRDDCYVGIVDR